MKEERHIHFLDREEVKLLLNSITDLKHKCIVLIMLDAGLRVSEAISLRFGNFEFQQKIIKVKSLKKRKGKDFGNRIIPISPRLFSCLVEYSKLFDTPDNLTYLFPSPLYPNHHITRNAVWVYLKRLNIKSLNIQELHPHTLRHSFATGLVATGADLHKIADLLGHQNIDTSRIYTHIPQEQLAKSIYAASTRNGYSRSFFNFFNFFQKPAPAIYVPNQTHQILVGRAAELQTISTHLAKGTNVILFGAYGTGKRLILESVLTDKKILTFDDMASVKKSLIYLLLYLYKNEKLQIATLMFKEFDPAKVETHLSRQSIGYLCGEIKKLVEPKEYILKIKQFDDITKSSMKVIDQLKETFVILTCATEISITKAAFFGNFEKIELKNLNRLHTFEMIHKSSAGMEIEDYEVYKNHIWLQSDGNPRVIRDMVERYRAEPRLANETVRSVTHSGALKEWDCTYFLVLIIASLAIMRYMTTELDNPALRTIGGMAMILLLLTRSFAAKTKRSFI